MTLPIPRSLDPMEAELRPELPGGEGWIFEPKWDGFRCLAFRDRKEVELRSKSGKPLTRYFPDIVDALLDVAAERFVLDGEIVIPVGQALSFDDLLLRIHPAASRVRTLAGSTPGLFVAFDLLADDRGTDLSGEPLLERREALERFAAEHFGGAPRVRLSPVTRSRATAEKWLHAAREGLDGVMAKRGDLPYQSGSRSGMVKVKRMRTADCVVGGFRWTKSGDRVASLLLGLYGDDGLLHHVGFCAALNERRRKEADERLIVLRGGDGFDGRAPVGHSRWRKEGSGEWEAVRPEVVVEVQYDHFSGGRFRHGTRFQRWRPDKAPRSCTLDQVEREAASALGMI